MRLYILRHAKAGQTHKKILDDHERTLTDLGTDQCKITGKHLKSTNASIDLILCSTSTRTKQTAELTLKEFGKDIETDFISRLYLGSANELLNEINTVSPSKQDVMIVGHNPGLHQLAISLVKDGNEEMIKKLSSSFSPGTLAVMDFDTDKWSEVQWRTGTLVDYLETKKGL